MKKFILVFIISFLLIGGVIYYLATKDKGSEVPASYYIEEAEKLLKDRYYSEALEQYKLAINADPSNTDSYISAAEIYVLKSKDQEAVELLKNGETIVANPDKVHHKIGKVLFDNNDLTGALEYLEKAHEENPQNWQCTIDLTKLYSYFPDKKDSMLEALNKINKDDNQGYGWRNYYLAILSYDDSSKTIEYLEEVSQITEGELKTKITNFLEVAKKVQSDPDDIVQNSTLIAYEIISAELYQTAIPLLEKIISENDEYYAAYMYMGICYIHMNDLDKAREQLEKANNVDPEQIQPLVFLAQVFTRQNNQKDAIDTFEKALNIEKDSEEVRLDYARTLFSFELYTQASLEYKELIDLNTDNLFLYKIELAKIEIDHLENPQEGLTIIKEVVEDWEGFQSADKSTKAQALDTLGWAFSKNGEKDNAIKYLKQSLESDPAFASAYYHLGIIYAEIGNYSEAKVNFERAIDLDLEGMISSKASSELEKLSNENQD
ncbi:tetratricopeptide repeat protein [Candidatus Dojkabacteria bacterium]|nr:tetratricopeptide repeat protein [Candidatus Dojkabacteria bacterium]